MHESVWEFVDELGRTMTMLRADIVRVLEVGSRDENGSVRSLFNAWEYIGTDLREGPGVDLVWDATTWPPPPPLEGRTFGVVLCLEMMEHCSRPWLAVEHMARLLAPGGMLVLTTRGFESGHFPVHGYPDDFYRYSLGAVEVLFREAGLTTVSIRQDPQFPGLLAVAEKP